MFPLENLFGRVIITDPDSTDHTYMPVSASLHTCGTQDAQSQQCLLPTCQVFPSGAVADQPCVIFSIEVRNPPHTELQEAITSR